MSTLTNKDLELLKSFADNQKIKAQNHRDITLAQISSNEKISIADLGAKKEFYASVGKDKARKYYFYSLLFIVSISAIIYLANNGHKDLIEPIIILSVGFVGGYGYGFANKK